MAFAILSFSIIGLAIISTLENLIVIIVMFKHKALQTPSILLFGALACIDLLTGCIVTPIKIALTFYQSGFLFHTFWWMFTAVVFFSLATILTISFDRFFHVYFLEKYHVTKKKVGVAMLICWIPPFILTVCMAFGRFDEIDTHSFACGLFFFCVITMVITYAGMLIVIKKHSTNTDAHAHDSETQRVCIQNEKEAIKTTLIIVVASVAMNLPPALAFVGIWSRPFCAVTFYVFLANSAVNPLIYCLRIPVIKKHVMKCLRLETTSSSSYVEESEDAFLSLDADATV